MKKITFKSILCFALTLCSICITAQDEPPSSDISFVEVPAEIAPDEDTSTDLSCPSSGDFQNNNTRNVDISNPGPVNVGTVDDRTCYADYSESNVNGKDWGVYNITAGSNHWDAPNTLQPRIERSLPRSGETGVGSFARFTGIVRILEVGDAGSFGQNGSYLAQAKGKHTGGGGPNDPAICLYRAHPVYGEGINADKQVAFDIYAERILERGGSGSGREVVFLKRVNKNEEVSFELEVGFRADPNDPTKKIHYCDAVIGGEAFNYNIPEPERGLESGIRYGVYRVRGGRAQMRWANTTYQKEEIVDSGGLLGDVYRLKNVETGKFLTAVGNSATPTTMTDSGEAINTHWTFVESGSYFNIDNQGNNIDALRAVNADPYLVLSTGKDSPTADTDKTWTIHHNATDDTYRFESRFNGRILYHETDGSVYHKLNVLATDDRGNWEAIPTSVTLSNSDLAINEALLKIYPNPSEGIFTIAFPNVNGVKNIEIYSILGKRVYQNTLSGQSLEVKHADLKTGVYLVNVSTEDNKVLRSKLVVK